MPVRKKSIKRKKSLRTRRRKSKFKLSVKKKLRSFLLATISVFLAVVSVIAYGAYKFINAPFSDAANMVTVKEGVWTDGGQTTLLVALVEDINDPYANLLKLKLVNLDDISKKYRIYDLPVDVDIPYALNYGSGPLKRLYSVGNADQDRGMYAIEKTIFKLLAVKPDGYIVMDKSGLNKISDELGEINQDDIAASLRLKNLPHLPAAISLIRTESLTNMKISDVLSIIKFFHSTSSTSSSYKVLSKYYLLDSNNWDSLWQNRLDTSFVNKENIKVFIANASSDPKIPGLAAWGGRVVKNLGANVLAEQNAFTEFNESTIITDDLESETVRALSKTFGIDNIVLVSSLNKFGGYNPHIFRAKISLILTSF